MHITAKCVCVRQTLWVFFCNRVNLEQAIYKHAFLKCLKALQIKHAVKKFPPEFVLPSVCGVVFQNNGFFASLPGAVYTILQTIVCTPSSPVSGPIDCLFMSVPCHSAIWVIAEV